MTAEQREEFESIAGELLAELGYPTGADAVERATAQIEARAAMRVGIVSKWTASGQAVVARQIRSALDELGHETFVLARPGSGPARASRGGAASSIRSGTSPASPRAPSTRCPLAEYEDWARANSLEPILFDENYQFDEIGALRERGHPDDRPLRLGVLRRRARRAGAKAAYDDDLLAAPAASATATPSSGSRAPTCSGASTRSCSRRRRSGRREPEIAGGRVSLLLPRLASSAGASRSARCIKAFARGRRAITCGC